MLPDDGSGGGLFLSPVPVPPGDPGALSAAAATYTAAHGEIDRNRASLSSAAGQAGGTAWTGTGAAAYVHAASDLAAAYALTSAALAKGATALRTFSADLKTAQHTAAQANAAVAASNAAATAYLAAQASAQQTASAAQSAAQASSTADTTAAASPHSAQAQADASTAKTAASDAQSAATSAAQRLSTASAQYDADYSRAVSLSSLATRQARQAAAKAAAAFNAAASGLMGTAPRPAHGGAAGVPGGTAWQDIIGDLADWNDKAGWGLNAWGAFGAVVLSKAEVVYLEAQADLGKAISTYDGAVAAVQDGKGFFSSNYYKAFEDLNGAFGDNRAAEADLLKAIAPAADDSSLMAALGRAGLGLGMASDVVTFISPSKSFGPDGLLGGNTDRGMAAANFAASGLALGSSADLGLATAAMAIPGVDVVVGVVLVGTAAYFAGEFVYQHWDDITHGAAAAWHGIEDAGSWASSETDKLGHDIGKAFSWL